MSVIQPGLADPNERVIIRTLTDITSRPGFMRSMTGSGAELSEILGSNDDGAEHRAKREDHQLPRTDGLGGYQFDRANSGEA